MRRPISRAAVLLVALFAAACLAVAIAPDASAQEPSATITLSPVGQNVDWDDGTFTVVVDVSGIDHHPKFTDGMGAYEITIGFNPNVVDVTATQAGDFLRESGRRVSCFERSPRRGEHAVACVSTGSRLGVQGAGRLATITLRPRANGRTYLPIQVTLSDPLGSPIESMAVGGIVAVHGAPREAPTPSPNNNNGNGGNGGNGNGSNGWNWPGQVITGGLGGGNNSNGNGSTGNNGGNGANGSGSDSGNGNGTGDPSSPEEGFPIAGTGYRPPDATWPVSLAGMLVAGGGAVLLLGGATFAARPRRD